MNKQYVLSEDEFVSLQNIAKVILVEYRRDMMMQRPSIISTTNAERMKEILEIR
jgi:hypothetical protein